MAKGVGWLRVLVGGASWAAVYNLLWGVAWFVFMRREWLDASATIGEPMPWTLGFWVVWVPLTLPFGMAITAYITSRGQSASAPKAAVAASLVLWMAGTVGMTVWGRLESFDASIIALDSAVNLLAVVAASLAVERSQRAWPPSPKAGSGTA